MRFVSYVAQAYILNELWVDIHLPDALLQELEDQPIEVSVFETSTLRFCKGCPYRECDHYIIGVLRCAVE